MKSQTRSIIIILSALLFLTATGMVAASPATTQASPLYPIKKAIEAASLAFAAPEDKAALQATQLEERVTELDALKLQIAELEKNQLLEKATKLQEAATSTEIAAKQLAAQAKLDAEKISDTVEKKVVLNQINASVNDLDDEDEDTEEIEADEPDETPEPAETPEPKETPEARESSGSKEDSEN
ncbi:MAG: DUF5667 domain-containing protein [Anaerolineales bacterium]|nr:DUF5667 domain-containing protein [Anaerolineales bacterium]